jgi:hypothetical protein
MDGDLKPLPKRVQWWRRTRDQRRRAAKSFRTGVARALTLAISVLGATLISYGVYQVYPPAGYVVGGALCWVLLWSHEQDKRRHG